MHTLVCKSAGCSCTVVDVSDLAAYLADAKGDRSIDAIAKQAVDAGHPISRSVVAKYLRGEHGPRPPEKTLAGLAAGFRVDVRVLRELAGRPAGEREPYIPVAEAASLTQAQRDALDQLIMAFVSEGGSDAGDTHQKMPGGLVVPDLTNPDSVELAAADDKGREKRIDTDYEPR